VLTSRFQEMIRTGVGVNVGCSCSAASEMLMTNLDLRHKWNGAVEWLHDELERVSVHGASFVCMEMFIHC